MGRTQYSKEDLLQLRGKCDHVCRTVRRRLFYFRIYVRHVPVIISKSRSCVAVRNNSCNVSPKFLVNVPLNNIKQNGNRRPKERRYPYPKNFILSNVRSILNKYDDVHQLFLSSRPDICVFTESWLEPAIPNEAVDVPGYNVLRRDRVERKGGGILCYLHFNLKYYLIDHHHITSSCTSEFLVVYIKNFHLFLVCVYHPFWNNTVSDVAALSCIADLIDYGIVRFGVNLRIILCGDFNGLRNQYTTISCSCHLKPLVDFSTRATNCLDQIFSNFSSDIKCTSLPPIGRSDHLVVIWRPTQITRPSSVKRKVRKFSRSNSAGFYSAISNYDWFRLVQSVDDLNDAAALFCNCVYHLFDFFFPWRTIRVRSDDPPWMKISLKILIDDRDRAYACGQMSKYKRLRTEVINHTRQLKANFMNLAASSGNSAAVWRSLRVVGRCSKFKNFSQDFSVHDFNDYFTSNFQSDSVPLTESLPPNFFITDSQSFHSIDLYEVFNMLRSVPRKNSGPDGIPPWVLSDCAESFSPAVTYLFNRSLNEGCVPSCFKLSNVTPIPKCEHPDDVSNFRPISILPTLSKILEKIVCKKFIFPVVKSKIDKSQFAYIPRPGSGVTSALVLTYHKILEFLDRTSGGVRVMSADFSKAFDKLLHTNIISACLNFGLPEFIVKWVISFLSDRKQRVCLNNLMSSWSTVTSGVPQGSVLGPVLFCLATDSLSPVCPNTYIMKYADDVTFLHFVHDSCDDNLQAEFDNLLKWSSDVHLPLNFNKCCVMDIITKKNMCFSDVSLPDGTSLCNVSSLRLLGVIFSSDMRWNEHFENIVKRASRRLYIMYNLRRSGCPKFLMFRSYTAFIRSLLLFASPVFCNAPAYLFASIVRLERRIFKIIGSNDFPTFVDVSKKMCAKMMCTIKRTDTHPLRVLFKSNHKRFIRSLVGRNLRPPLAKTVRFSSSFIKFCD